MTFIGRLTQLAIPLALGLCLASSKAVWAQSSTQPNAERLEFFESRIRPVLVTHCYECHNSSDSADGNLVLDFRGGWQKGGDGGAVILPGEPAKSRLLKMIRHEIEGMEMPSGGPKLSDNVIRDFETWIQNGSVDPRDKPPSSEELAAATSWDVVFEERKKWWSFQPIQSVEPPTVQTPRFSKSPIDRFLEHQRTQQGLVAVGAAEDYVLVRRLFFVLTGLPASVAETKRWVKELGDASSEHRSHKLEALVDELISRPAFAERWARHWMDWIRYAESHGSEGDPEIAEAWRYRDYLVRAIDQDVPVDQLIREHIAGDLLQEPRINAQQQWNESAIGPSHLRMVFHGFAPTDALDEKVRFTDDQVNVVSKAFLGLTVSCARCHDHKFDAISQKDYYGLYGVFASGRPGRTKIDLPTRSAKAMTELKTSLVEFRQRQLQSWQEVVSSGSTDAPNHIGNFSSLPESAPAWMKTLSKAVASNQRLPRLKSDRRVKEPNSDAATGLQGLSDFGNWYSVQQKGRPVVHDAGTLFLKNVKGDVKPEILPSGVYSSVLTDRQGDRLMSRSFKAEGDQQIWVLAKGTGNATLRFVVHNYPRNGLIYPVYTLTPEWKWHRLDLSYWDGEQVHLELTTSLDAPLLVKKNERSWFGVRRVLVQPKSDPPPTLKGEVLDFVTTDLAAEKEVSTDTITSRLQDVAKSAIESMQQGTANDPQALLLNDLLAAGWLPQLNESPRGRQLLDQIRKRDEQFPIAVRVPGIDDVEPFNQPLYVRGDHRQPADEVPRRFLSAIDSKPYTVGSGRRELAEDLLRSDNPLTRRVLVNRIWHHVFGNGIVRTPDNFGRLGALPTHPELLDWLALEFERQDWSLKSMVKMLVLTETFQLSSTATARATAEDPENNWLTHSNLRRMEAEVIRDHLVALTGKADNTVGGPPVKDSSFRRSLYLRVRRNSLNPFLRVFDFPEPSATVGRRSSTNVPAQSLTMLNDPFVIRTAELWARQTLLDVTKKAAKDAEYEFEKPVIERLFMTALGRSPDPYETVDATHFLHSLSQTIADRQHRRTQQEADHHKLSKQRDQLQAAVTKRIEDSKDDTKKVPVPDLVSHWNFTDSEQDVEGLALHGKATLTAAGLELPGNAWASSQLGTSLRAKTLMAIVRLSDLNQRGGGVISVQTPDGVSFDSIVFGEQQAQHWLAGSNYFKRTQSFKGAPEAEAARQFVQIAIAWHADGTVICYRNGQPYGEPYQVSELAKFESSQAVVTLGLRHLPSMPGRHLKGMIRSASVFSRALTPDEIRRLAGERLGVITLQDVVEAMTKPERDRYENLTSSIKQAQRELDDLQPAGRGTLQERAVTELAKSMLLLQELIYVR